ncbi:hypothetical protein [Phocaeicola sartorii]|uniref:Uncharacterized protein n=1 Tax=Phocaeicola sartorii TaxID=671267 RepID=R9IDE9_9BACT|nr:hypothetical protein [Phocaeicola sartorii]EOS16617.1 hypothetical protein C802_00296 [Phocaeicola sartorii]MCR1847024.1 hypothetical protein [Phocaeicola sartorii]
MKITDWIKELLRDDQPRLSYRELQELSEKAERAAGVYNHKELTGLIRRYRKSDEAVGRIALAIAKSEPFYCPESTINRDSIEMMEALADTPFMERHGRRLSDIGPEDATAIHGLLAIYTFMQDEELRKFPKTGMERPAHDEVISAIRILDGQRRNRDITELCELSAYSMLPSRYVMMRYGLERDCDAYRCMEDNITASDNPRALLQAQADMCVAAEKAVENIPGVRLPDFYLENLDRELDRLGRIVVSPDAVNDLVHTGSDFLTKYGLDRDALPEEQSRQAWKAYRELDGRFVRMTGRRPYTEGLSVPLRQKSGNTETEKARTQAARSNHIRNPPPTKGKSRKPSF